MLIKFAGADMSDVISKCTERGPARVGCCVGRSLLRKAELSVVVYMIMFLRVLS